MMIARDHDHMPLFYKVSDMYREYQALYFRQDVNMFDNWFYHLLVKVTTTNNVKDLQTVYDSVSKLSSLTGL